MSEITEQPVLSVNRPVVLVEYMDALILGTEDGRVIVLPIELVNPRTDVNGAGIVEPGHDAVFFVCPNGHRIEDFRQDLDTRAAECETDAVPFDALRLGRDVLRVAYSNKFKKWAVEDTQWLKGFDERTLGRRRTPEGNCQRQMMAVYRIIDPERVSWPRDVGSRGYQHAGNKLIHPGAVPGSAVEVG